MKGRTTPNMNEEEQALAIQLYTTTTEPVRAIAERVKRSPTAIQNLMKKKGLSRRKRRGSVKQRVKTAALALVEVRRKTPIEVALHVLARTLGAQYSRIEIDLASMTYRATKIEEGHIT